ncbi:MAG: VWA domain-containing protein [Treponema sp.]|nr:VWA domain-containing protein [Treponema sp.]
MNISSTRPILLLALFVIIPVIIIRLVQIKKLEKRLRRSLLVKLGFHTSAFAMLVFALADIYWGSHLVPVQKNASAVSFVFDISNSMNAKDGPEGISRLEASAEYAKKIISYLEGTSISIVLAKGDGIAAIPLTEDYLLINSLLEVLSPNLMTAPGSSLGKGLLTAKESFSTNFTTSGRIWLFTDGEETDSSLQNALGECIKNGIPVTIIGFGQEREISVLAGDGKTVVFTALRKEKILNTINEVEKRFASYNNRPKITFVSSTDKGSAIKLLNDLKTSNIISYESKAIPQYKFFILFAIIFFAAGFLFTELNLSSINKASAIMLISIIIPIFLMSCSKSKSDILKGSYAYNQQQYQHSISLFMKAAKDSAAENDKESLDFCLYDLGTSYLKLDEDAAAMEKFSQISSEAPNSVKYRAFYNAGIIAHKNADYQGAADFFKKALEADNSKIDAKINLELSIQEMEVNVKNNQNQSSPSNQEKSNNSDLEKAIFQRIKENDKKQWKNSEESQAKNLADDF